MPGRTEKKQEILDRIIDDTKEIRQSHLPNKVKLHQTARYLDLKGHST